MICGFDGLTIFDTYYYMEINASDFLSMIKHDYHIALHMCNTPFEIIKDMQENFIILKNKYRTLRFTFSDNLSCSKNNIIDIRNIEE